MRLQDDTEFDAKILGRDPKTDIAVLKINPGKTKLVAVGFGDSKKLRVGDWVGEFTCCGKPSMEPDNVELA